MWAFFSTGVRQIVRVLDGTPTMLTNPLPAGTTVSSIRFSPDGLRLTYAATIPGVGPAAYTLSERLPT